MADPLWTEEAHALAVAIHDAVCHDRKCPATVIAAVYGKAALAAATAATTAERSSPMSLRDRIIAEIERQERVTAAVAAALAGARLPALDDSDRRRRLVHYRRIIARHAPSDDIDPDSSACMACGGGPWANCPEIRDLAEALGVSVGD